MSDLSHIVKAYDVRGTVPDQMNDNVARAIGAAFIQTLRATGENADRKIRANIAGISLACAASTYMAPRK